MNLLLKAIWFCPGWSFIDWPCCAVAPQSNSHSSNASHCECVQWAASLGPGGEWPAAIHSAQRSSLELYRHTIVRLTLETSSCGPQTLHTKCQFAAKLSALSSWFIEPGPPFTILSSSGGISIACAMGRYLFKHFSGVKRERESEREKGSQAFSWVWAFNMTIVESVNKRACFSLHFLKKKKSDMDIKYIHMNLL